MEDRVAQPKTEQRRSRFKDLIIAVLIVCAGAAFFLNSIISLLIADVSDTMLELQTVARYVYLAVILLLVVVFALRALRRMGAGSKV